MNLHLRRGSVVFALAFAPGCLYSLMPPVSMSGTQPEERRADPAALALPEGYRATVVAKGLDFPVGVAVDADGTVWVVESGYSYGEVRAEGKLLRLRGDGEWDVVASGSDVPWTGVDAAEGALFVAEGGEQDGGAILRVTPAGEVTTLVSGLPGHGDHYTGIPAVKDGWVYFGQGTATNSAVVGLDNHFLGWLARRPDYHDRPCAAVRVTGETWVSPNPLTADPDDSAATGPYAPFGQVRGPEIPGEIPCNGAVMRVPTMGGPLELVAWGFRNPYGLAFAGDRLFATDNGADARGSRPINGGSDSLWEVTPGAWYGWPDFVGGEPVDQSRFAKPLRKPPARILVEPPGIPPAPAASFGVHASANGIAFAPDAFGLPGEALVAEFGDLAPGVGKLMAPVGRRVVRVDPATGVIRPFAETRKDAVRGTGIERPVDVAFAPDGRSVYVADFGVMTIDGVDPRPMPDTGVIWRIIRVDGPPKPIAQTPLEARGEEVFARACHSCHPDGGAGMGPSTLLPPRFVVPIQVRLGLGVMPAFSKDELPREDMKALMAWLKRLDEGEKVP